MEYCSGGDLQRKIQHQRGIHFDQATVVNWTRQLASALRYIHSVPLDCNRRKMKWSTSLRLTVHKTYQLYTTRTSFFPTIWSAINSSNKHDLPIHVKKRPLHHFPPLFGSTLPNLSHCATEPGLIFFLNKRFFGNVYVLIFTLCDCAIVRLQSHQTWSSLCWIEKEVCYSKWSREPPGQEPPS